MLPAVTVAVGNATALRINPRLPAEAVTVKGTPGRGRVPSPMSTVAVPLKVALPSAPTDPPRTSPSTGMFCAAPRREVPTTARHRDARASLKCLPSDGGECWVTGAPAARAGKAILLEKPLAARPRDARRISRAVRRTGVPAMIAHTPRFDPRVRARLREVRKLAPSAPCTSSSTCRAAACDGAVHSDGLHETEDQTGQLGLRRTPEGAGSVASPVHSGGLALSPTLRATVCGS